jgi:uncharacterized protein YjdB
MKLVNAPPGVRISYQVHVQNIGWQDWKADGGTAGTSGQSLRLEGIRIILEGLPGYGVEYQTHVQNIGWQNWKANGEMSGTQGLAYRLEAIKIKLNKI